MPTLLYIKWACTSQYNNQQLTCDKCFSTILDSGILPFPCALNKDNRMSEALDLSINATTRTPATSTATAQSPALDQLDPPSPTSLFGFSCGTDFLQKCASTFNHLSQPLLNQAASILPALNQTNCEFRLIIYLFSCLRWY